MLLFAVKTNKEEIKKRVQDKKADFIIIEVSTFAGNDSFINTDVRLRCRIQIIVAKGAVTASTTRIIIVL